MKRLLFPLKLREPNSHRVYYYKTHTDSFIIPRVKMHFLHLPVHKTHVLHMLHEWGSQLTEYIFSKFSHSFYILCCILFTFVHIHTHTGKISTAFIRFTKFSSQCRMKRRQIWTLYNFVQNFKNNFCNNIAKKEISFVKSDKIIKYIRPI